MSNLVLAAGHKQTPASIALAQASERQASYDSYMAQLKSVIDSSDPRHVQLVRATNDGLLRVKELGPGQVHVDSTLANVSVQYKNGEYIGELLMPAVTVPKKSDKYWIYDKRSRLAYPDDGISARGSANEINDNRSTDNYSCQDYGFKNFVDAETLANEDAPLNEMVDLVEAIAEGVAFKREQRIAAKVTTLTNYAAANRQTNVGGSQWNSGGGGNPVLDLQNARAALWNGRGPSKIVAWSSLETYNVLASHPMILDLFKYSGTTGLATPQMIASFFGFADYLIGEARQDTANEGQTASYSRIWGKHFGCMRVATRPGLRNASFGYTMRFGTVITNQWYDMSLGTEGGYYARVAVREDHKVVANDTGYFIQNAIA